MDGYGAVQVDNIILLSFADQQVANIFNRFFSLIRYQASIFFGHGKGFVAEQFFDGENRCALDCRLSLHFPGTFAVESFVYSSFLRNWPV